MMQNYNIREAEFNDSSPILKLIKELAEFENEPNAVNLLVEDIQKDGFGVKPKFKCFVAEIDNCIIGMALYYPRYSTWDGQTLHLEDLIVSRNHRGKGVGKRLYIAFINEALKAGFKRVEWNVLDWNEVAIKFYESTGAEILKDWRTVQMPIKGMIKFIRSNNKN
jgi:GNAT superfamily N-acetyltransferase